MVHEFGASFASLGASFGQVWFRCGCLVGSAGQAGHLAQLLVQVLAGSIQVKVGSSLAQNVAQLDSNSALA